MSQYQIGTVNVTNGSDVITGNGTLWLANITALDEFRIRGGSVSYSITSIDSNIQITLSSNYAGATADHQFYQITRNFTVNYRFPEICFGDKDWPYGLTLALEGIDTQIKTLSDRIETKPTGTTSTTSTSTCSSTSSTCSTSSTLSTTTTTSPP